MERQPQRAASAPSRNSPDGQRRLPSPPNSNSPRQNPPDVTSDSALTIHVANDQSTSSNYVNQTKRPEKPGQKRRGRHMVSCAECRRRKLKCDRSVPCSNCVKRECPDICPSGTRNKVNKEVASHERRIAQLEALLQEKNAQAPPHAEPRSECTAFSSQNQRSSPSPQPLHYEAEAVRNLPVENDPLPHSTMNGHDFDHLSSHNVNYPIPNDGMEYGWTEPSGHQIKPPMSLESEAPPHQTRISQDSLVERSPIQQAPPTRAVDDEAFGTLVVDHTGRSKYLGPRAGTEWLQNQERPGPSRAISEEVEEHHQHLHTSFPFGPQPTFRSKVELFSNLPPREETVILVEAYFRCFAWNLTPITRPAFNTLLDRVYNTTRIEDLSTELHMHQLALLFSVFAMGAHHCLEYPPNDSIVEEYIKLAKCCLSQGDFLVKNTIPGLQALSLIGHLSTETERGRRGDFAWPLYGLAMRLVQAMGIHRDGSKWNLPSDVIEERRLVFWECYTIDTFQAHCFSRPPLMRANHFDTELPRQSSSPADLVVGTDGNNMAKDFKSLKYEIVKILASLLDLTMDITPPPYAHVNDQYEQVCAFERCIPFHLRCRHALVATISRYPMPEAAACDSPPPNRRDLKRTFEQFTLAMHVCEAILFLQRPYFVRAMNESPSDPVLSQHGASFLAVVERCNVVTQIVRGLTELFPSVASRHWFYWYHLFNAAVCVGSLVLRCPQSPMAPFALTILDQAISAYSVVTRQNTSATLNSNHERLLQLRRRSMAKMSQGASGGANGAHTAGCDVEDGEKTDQHTDEGLLGWRTRLIERGESTSNQHKATTIVYSPGRGPNMPVDNDGRSSALDSTPPFLSMLFMDTQLPSADLMMHQHFATASEFRREPNENDGQIT